MSSQVAQENGNGTNVKRDKLFSSKATVVLGKKQKTNSNVN